METPPDRRAQVVMLLVANVIAIFIIAKAFESPTPEEQPAPAAAAPQQPPASASGAFLASPSEPAAPSEYARCREVEANYKKMQETLKCGYEYFVARGLCEAAYADMRDCIDEFEALMACVQKGAEQAWVCDKENKLQLNDSFCAAELGTVAACGQR